MNYNQHFDKHIKDQFTDYTPSVHPRIWENITNQRDKKRPAGFWFTFLNGRTLLFAAALLLAIGSAGYFLLQHEGKTATAATTADNTVQQPLLGKTATDGTQNEATTALPQTTAVNSPSVNAFAAPVTTAGSVNNTAIVPNTINNKDDYNADAITTGKVNKNNLPTVPGAENFYTPAKSKKTNHSAARLLISYKNGAVGDDDGEETAFASQLPSLFFTAEKTSGNNIAATLQKRKQKNVLLPDCPSIEKNAAGNKTYIEIYGGPDFAFRSFSDTGNSAYLQKRKESTKFASAYSAGLRYTKVFNNGVSIRTGINYSQINEKFIYNEGNIIQVVYILNAAGDTIGSYTTTGTRYKTTHNKFRTIDVPIAVGYELGNGRLHANINAGVIVNIYSWQRGEVLDYNLRPVNITTGKSNSPFQFKTNIGIGFIGGASLYYKMNDRLHFMAEPYFRYSLAPASKETTTFKQKYNTAGLRLGLRLDLH